MFILFNHTQSIKDSHVGDVLRRSRCPGNEGNIREPGVKKWRNRPITIEKIDAITLRTVNLYRI